MAGLIGKITERAFGFIASYIEIGGLFIMGNALYEPDLLGIRTGYGGKQNQLSGKQTKQDDGNEDNVDTHVI